MKRTEMPEIVSDKKVGLGNILSKPTLSMEQKISESLFKIF